MTHAAPKNRPDRAATVAPYSERRPCRNATSASDPVGTLPSRIVLGRVEAMVEEVTGGPSIARSAGDDGPLPRGVSEGLAAPAELVLVERSGVCAALAVETKQTLLALA